MHPAPPSASNPEWTSFAWPRTYPAGRVGAALVHRFGAGLIVGGAFALRFVLRLEDPTSGKVAAQIRAAVCPGCLPPAREKGPALA